MMRAIKIDPEARTIQEIETKGDLAAMKEILSDGPCMVRVTDGDVLWVGDNGFIKEGMPVFRLDGYANPLAGVGFILGLDEEGENVATTVEVALVKAHVIWTDMESTGELEPTTEEKNDKGTVIKIGQPILRERKRP